MVDTEKYLLLENTEHQVDVSMERKLQEGEEDLVSGVGNLNMDQVRTFHCVSPFYGDVYVRIMGGGHSGRVVTLSPPTFLLPKGYIF